MAPPKLSMDDTIKLIRLYKEKECLWQSDSVEYRNKAARDSALIWIRDSMGIPNMTVEDIKTKLKYLRSTFVQEQHKIKKSQKSGAGSADVYVPTLQWFNEMASFITYNPATTSTFNNVEVDMNDSQENMLGDSSDNATQNATPLINSQSQETLTNRVSVDGEQPTKPKRSRLAQLNNMINNMKQTSQNLNNIDEDDEYTAFGIHIAKQLRKLSVEQYLYAQEEIQSIITRCRLQDLRHTMATVPSRDSTNLQIASPPTANPHVPGTFRIFSQGPSTQKATSNYAVYTPIPSTSPASLISSSTSSNSNGPGTIQILSQGLQTQPVHFSNIYTPVPSTSPASIISSAPTSDSQDILQKAYDSAFLEE